MSAMYEVTLAPAAMRIVSGLRASRDRKELLDALVIELVNGPNSGKELRFPADGDLYSGAIAPGRMAYTATPLSFNGYTALHRPMARNELGQLQDRLARAVADHGCYVIDILSAESAFGRPRLF